METFARPASQQYVFAVRLCMLRLPVRLQCAPPRRKGSGATLSVSFQSTSRLGVTLSAHERQQPGWDRQQPGQQQR